MTLPPEEFSSGGQRAAAGRRCGCVQGGCVAEALIRASSRSVRVAAASAHAVAASGCLSGLSQVRRAAVVAAIRSNVTQP